MNPEDLYKLIKSDPNTWFTLNEIAQKSNIPESEVQKLVTNSNLFVRSGSLSSSGENLFATREDFQKNESFANKVLGAFKNRID